LYINHSTIFKKDHGIEKKMSIMYTPQQNDVVGHANTLMYRKQEYSLEMFLPCGLGGRCKKPAIYHGVHVFLLVLESFCGDVRNNQSF
jgi:hypothetical protein